MGEITNPNSTTQSQARGMMAVGSSQAPLEEKSQNLKIDDRFQPETKIETPVWKPPAEGKAIGFSHLTDTDREHCTWTEIPPLSHLPDPTVKVQTIRKEDVVMGGRKIPSHSPKEINERQEPNPQAPNPEPPNRQPPNPPAPNRQPPNPPAPNRQPPNSPRPYSQPPNRRPSNRRPPKPQPIKPQPPKPRQVCSGDLIGHKYPSEEMDSKMDHRSELVQSSDNESEPGTVDSSESPPVCRPMRPLPRRSTPLSHRVSNSPVTQCKRVQNRDDGGRKIPFPKREIRYPSRLGKKRPYEKMEREAPSKRTPSRDRRVIPEYQPRATESGKVPPRRQEQRPAKAVIDYPNSQPRQNDVGRQCESLRTGPTHGKTERTVNRQYERGKIEQNVFDTVRAVICTSERADKDLNVLVEGRHRNVRITVDMQCAISWIYGKDTATVFHGLGRCQVSVGELVQQRIRHAIGKWESLAGLIKK